MLQQSQIINVRVNPRMYQIFKDKIMAKGLNPSTYLRHVVISLALTDDDLGKFVSNLPQNKISDSEAMSLIDRERKKNKLVVKSYDIQKKINWAKIWANINSSRSFKGERGNLSGFIVSDRENH